MYYFAFLWVLSLLCPRWQEYIERGFSKDEFRVWQYAVFAAMGVLCGFVGPLYVNFRLNMLKVGFRVFSPARCVVARSLSLSVSLSLLSTMVDL